MSGKTTDSRLEPGTMLAHYKVQAELGSGAMGTVYLAHDTSLDRSVAVKVLHREISKDPEIVSRFEREARAAARVNHPNLTHVYFVGAEEDRRFFAMEHVPGKSLFQKIDEEGPLELPVAIDVLVQAARGLAAAHAAEVIHRDVKPSNLMLLPNGTVKVADFGLAKSLTGDVDATGAGRVMGTPRYMSPEQCRGETVDRSTDAYSLGLVAFFILTGEHAYEGESLGQVIHDQMNKPLRPLEALLPDISPAVQDVLAKLCAKSPKDRPKSMEEVERLLETLRPRVLDPAPVVARGAALLTDVFMWMLVLLASAFVLQVLLKLGVDWAWPLRIASWTGFAVLMIGTEWRFGGSPAKLLFRTRVVRQDGTRAGLPMIVLRFLLRFPVVGVVALPLSGQEPGLTDYVEGGLWALQLLALLTGAVCYLALRERTLSDIVTRTRVIQQSQTPQSP